MPPKKKKPPVNIVVGTVSTRSTRRQSIVNIEIPKSKRSSTKKPTAKDEKDSLIITPNIQTEPIEDKNLPTKIQHSRTSAPERKVTKKSSTQVPRRGRSSGSLPDSNKELLRILDDWTDEEGQDRTDTSSLGYTESESSIGPVNLNSGTDGLKTTFENQFENLSQDSTVEATNEEVGIVEGIKEFLEVEAGKTEGTLQECQDSTSADEEVIEKISSGVENEDVVIENTNSSSGMYVPEVEEPCIVEQNVIIEDSQEAKDDIQIECVTDDVIPTELMIDEESTEISQAVHNEMPQTDEDDQMNASEVVLEDTVEDTEQLQEESGDVYEIPSKEGYNQLEGTEPVKECSTNLDNDCTVDTADVEYQEINQVLPEETSETMSPVQQKDSESMGEIPQENYEVMEEIQQEEDEAFQTAPEDTPRDDTDVVEGAPLQDSDEIYTGQMEDESFQEQPEQNDENYLRDDEEIDANQIDESSQDHPGQSDETPQEYNEEIIQEVEKVPNETTQEAFEVADENNQETFEVLQGDIEIQSGNRHDYNQMESADGITVENIQIVHEVNSQLVSNDDSNYVEEQEDETIVTGEEVLQEEGVEVTQYDENHEEQFLQKGDKTGSALSTAELERTLSEGMTQDTYEVVDTNEQKQHGCISNENLFQSTPDDSLLNSKMAFLHLQGTNNEAKGMDQEMAELSLDPKEHMSSKSLVASKKKDEKAKPRPRPSKSAEPKPKSPKQQKAKEKLPKPKAIKEKVAKEKAVKPKFSKDKESKGEKKSSTKKTTKENGGKKELSEKSSAKTEEEKKSEEDQEVRRSSRIKSISVQKRRTTGHGLVKYKSETSLMDVDLFDANSSNADSDKGTPSASPKVKERKSRWSKSVDTVQHTQQLGSTENMVSNDSKMVLDEKPNIASGDDPVVQARLRSFVHLKENMYKTERLTCKEAKKMTCDCFLTDEEVTANEYGCGEDCLNRLLLIECGNLCQVGDRCTNKRFQKSQFAPVEVFNTDKKGLGLRAAANIPFGEFILEYVGEVLNTDEFDKRAEVYSQDKNIHYYFMALRADAIIDATMKGNISRFINHSCDPNAETQKWTVNGELRIGFFSTRTILAGEEITFDYRFQRYGKEAQKCYCGAAICRGWLGEQPDSDEEEEEVVEEEMVAVAEAEPLKEAILLSTDASKEAMADVKAELPMEEAAVPKIEIQGAVKEEVAEETIPAAALDAAPIVIRKKVIKKKPRIEMFEEIDQLNEEIDMLVTTGLKNQAHTLKLSRLMVRAKEPQQRAKLLRVLRKGELPCRRLFLDYHGLRLMHGYMIDAQHLVMADKKFESQRLEMLQTLAVLPIPNKTMLQDSKVLPTVELWSTAKELTSPLDSDSNSPQSEQFDKRTTVPKKEDTDKTKIDPISGRSIEDQEEEIRFLATKLLEEWRNLKEVFKIPKKERIEQMKEHEREANKKFMQSSYGQEPEKDRKSERYRNIAKIKERDPGVPAKRPQKGEKLSAEFIRLTKVERRKLFALQHELKEEERRLKQRELWRQHEMNCMMMGTDPRFTAPFDPSRPYQCIWNPQIGQWQNYPLPPGTILPPAPTASLPNLPQPNMSMAQHNMNMPQHNLNMPQANLNMNIQQTPGMNVQHMNMPHPHQVSKSMATYPYGTNMGGMMGTASRQPMPPLPPTSMGQMNPMQGMPQVPTSNVQMLQYQEQKPKEEDPSQVKFMGPIPPPAKLPPKWKCAKDKYGRPYYYHIKIRKSQWEPPPLPPPPPPVEDVEESSETESSSDTSSLSSSSDSDESEDALDDTKLLQHVRRQMEKAEKAVSKTVDNIRVESMVLDCTPSPTLSDQPSEDRSEVEMRDSPLAGPSLGDLDESLERPSIDIRLKEQFSFMRDDNPSSSKKRRVGLCEEIIISPRSEEDKKQMKEDLKRYKANKEKLRRQKELLLRQSRQKEKERLKKEKTRLSLKEKIKEMPDFNSEIAKKIKETFRANMASTVVTSLNAYRKSDCREGRITNTEDFKHLARKLTHFVMLKEMKHISRIEDLTCTDNVKMKAREYIRKYMSKFGEVYVKRNDSPDFKD